MHQRVLSADADVARKLGLDGRSRRRRPWRWLIAALVLAGAAGGGSWWWAESHAAPEFRTAEARRGELIATVTATGTLEPTNQVEVGSEISGRIATMEADFNDHVEQGQTLATLDTDQLRAKVKQSESSLQAAEAGVREAMATVDEMAAKARRLRTLARRDFSSQQDLEVAEAASARAEAALASARAQVEVARAVLQADRTTLAKAIIRSPIDGVVIDRHVEVGQTVAASFQTPILFTLAQDLTEMELHLDIDEADVGHVKVGQQATFRVDAYPDQEFAATITSVRYAPRTVQGVVTYEAILAVANESLLLRPGMTATAEIMTARQKNVLLVPNGALRFTPPGAKEEVPPGRAGSPAGKRVWTLRGGEPVAIAVDTGLSDGRWTVVKSGDVTPGLPLLVDVVRPEET